MKRATKNTTKISFVGLGKLGLCLALCFASKDINVIGVDINKSLIKSLKTGRPMHYEPLLSDYLNHYKKNVLFTTDHNLAIADTDITIILVATPSDTYGKFSNVYVESALKSLAQSLKRSDKPYHLFILASTVMPESCMSKLIPLIEKNSGREFGKGFGFTLVPDFIALGSTIHDFLNPDFVLVGGENKKDIDITKSLYSKMVAEKTPIVSMSLTETELTKVALNCYLTTKISFANMFSQLCEKIPSVNVDNITGAIGLDKRIGKLYLKGGSPFGGTCFPRDVKAFMAISKKYKMGKGMIDEVWKINEKQTDLILEKIIYLHNKGDYQQVVFVGGAFKENTSVIEESIATKLIPQLIKKDIKVCIYDKFALEAFKKEYGTKIEYFNKISQAFMKNSIFVITQKNDETKSIDFSKNKKRFGIVDCWRVFCDKTFKSNDYVALGLSKESAS